ncbi:hypothetical protein [Melghirimyces algeriensis]|uniref:Uncharacterized protein n=1 Tax=Melghirimyces algeriensis TaxID=910412 RepID=A0A521F8Y5_9BACL|nr:hypothetical protein [Melghirimyces algeriensis]SMO92071.1 hypothetical protein SAMN06264849_11420 [Melghirimyces algeriensis]
MTTIEINRVSGNETEFVVGCEFDSKEDAERVFEQIGKEYQTKPKIGDGDFLVDLYRGHDLIDTVVTDGVGAVQIDERFFREE